jgi:serine phosphatase RsbU (regulator of sigma subunit)/ligand-binding sensor domain-containing protein
MRIKFIPIIICFVFFSKIYAGIDYSVEQIRLSKDLPISQISKLYFGNAGLLWIGTNKGLYYFDGYNYNSVISFFFNKNTLSSDNIVDITQDKQGDIWLLTQFGVEKFNIQTRFPEPIVYIPNVFDVIGFIHSHDSPALFVATDSVILKLDTKTKLIDTLYSNNELLECSPVLNGNSLWFIARNSIVEINLLSKTVSRIVIDKLISNEHKLLKSRDNIQLFLAIEKSLYSYNTQTKKLKAILSLPEQINHLSDVVDEKLLVGTKNKIFLCDLSDTSLGKFELLQSITGAIIQNIALDVNGIAWVATSKEILKINPYSKAFTYAPFLEDRLNYPDEESIVFESTKSGVVYKNTSNEFKFYNSLQNKYTTLPIDECTAACMFDSDLFIGDSNKLVKINLDNGQKTEISNLLSVNAIKQIDDFIWIATEQGLYIYKDNSLNLLCDLNVWDFLLKDNVVYIINDKGFGKLGGNRCNLELLIPVRSIKEKSRINDILQSHNGETWFATDNGLFQFIPDSARNISEQFQLRYEEAVYSLIEGSDSPEIWYSTDKGIGLINYITGVEMFFGFADGIKPNQYLVKGSFIDNDSNIYFATGKQIIRFNPRDVYKRKFPPNVIISKARFIDDEKTIETIFYRSDTIIIHSNIRYFELELSTFDYFSPKSTKYKFSLEPIGSAKSWRDVQNKNILSIGRLSPGKYNLYLKAKNNHGVESEKLRSLIIIVKAPILETKWAYFIYFVILIFMIFLLIRFRTRSLRRINKNYKEKELIAKRVVLQKEELTLKNKNITDSINYARRIQLAMMPSVRLFTSVFPDSFVLHLPKDIVSGDFYWINQVDNNNYFSAVDCTGHGVPGAFMSIIGVELFRRITEIEKISTPAEILNSLSRNFERVFGDVDEMKLRDGMDLAFCKINKEQTILEYAGAFNPLYIIRDSSIMEIKGDRHSVGLYEKGDEVLGFNNHVIQLQEGDTIYIFTDGFADQFGGPEQKKYKYRRFRHLLLTLHQLPMEKQKEFLSKSVLEWKGELDQVDDILVMGLKIHQNKKTK